MTPTGLIGALIGAAIGAQVWIAVSAKFNYETGYVALIIGLLTGLGAAIRGSKGNTSGLICAGLAIAAILAGKLLVAHFVMRSEMQSYSSFAYSPTVYEMITDRADDFANLKSENQYAEFMVSHDYSESSNPEQVSLEEVEEFKLETAEYLRGMSGENRPSYQQWSADGTAELSEYIQGSSFAFEMAFTDLGLFDIVFAILGVITAYIIGRGWKKKVKIESNL